MKNIRRAILGLSLFVTAAAFAAPSITSLTPNTGAIGSSIVIAGSGFGNNQSKATVKFNGTQATITSFSSTSITAAVPSGATTGNVVVTISGVASNGVTFTVTGAPNVSSLTPNTGAVGSSVVIAGSNFGPSQGNGLVTFTSGLTATVTSWSASSITATAPTNAATGNVVVTAAGGVASNGVSFTVTAAPSISSLTPSTGVVGSSVVIAGSSFGATQGNGGVTFNGTTATISSWSSTSITATVPTGAATGNVVVTAAGRVASDGVTFTIPPPSITNISPDLARVGASITITGNNFGPAPGSLTFNGTAAVPTSWSNTQIVTPVPSGATTGPVVVTQGGTSNSVNFTVDPPPSITSISPVSGPANTSVTVTGSGFGIPQGTSTIQFNGTAATPFSWSDGSIVVPVPVGSTTGPITVSSGGFNSNGVTFTVIPGPSISNVSVSSGAPGTSVTINGQNFGSTQGNSVVRFNGMPASVSTWAAGAIGVNVPSGATTGPVTVTVSNQTSNGMTFTVVTTGTLSGTVSSSSGGSPINGATMQALQNGTVKASTTSATDGTYSIPNIVSGNYDVQASASGFGTGVHNSVTITPGQTATANFSLSSPGTVSGTATQTDGVTAIAGATVQLLVGNDITNTTSADSSGNYSIGGLNAGTYALEAGAPNYVTQSHAITIAGGSTSTSNFLLQATGAGPINYVYDELGRLVSVSDSSGDTAIYKYDAAGNILSISRQNSSQLSIISFTPQSGTPGVAVTINGTGFSTTPSQNTVTFNGVAATVNSATVTQINTAVPLTATTGPITVTTPSGSISSSANFTVLANSGAPTVSGFTPNMGTLGVAVTISGTNFDIAANDKVTFNTTYVPASSATPSQVAANIPLGTGSGHISVTTPNGTATSAQDLFIPFGSHVVGDIGYTGRASFGNTTTISLASGKIALLLFDGTAGQGASLQLRGSTFANFCQLWIYSPTGSQLNGADCTSSVNNTFVLSTVLPSTGTYTIGLDPGTNSGSITVTLTQDITAPIVPGTPVNLNITTQGQGAHYTFQGTPGQIVSAEVAGFNGTVLTLTILSPDGSTVGSTQVSNGAANLVGQKLPKTGTYQLVVTPSSTGSAMVSLITQNSNPTISFNTPATTTINSTSLIGFSFSGTSGQVVSVETAGLGGGGFTMYLLNPDGSTLASVCCGANQASAMGKTLTMTGTHQIVIVPNYGVTGPATISVVTQTSNPAISFGTPVTRTITSSSLVGFSFNGTVGQIVSAEATGFGGGTFTTYLLNPDGTALASASGTNQLNIIGKTLAANGTYQIVVAPNNGVTGSVTLSLNSQTTNSAINFNTPVTTTISSASLIGYSFSGTAGQIVTVEGTGLSGNFSLYLLNPDGTTLASNTCCGSTLTLVGKTLATTGTYQILIVPNNGVTGSATISLISQTTNGTINVGTPVTSTITSSSLIGLSFSGTAGQIVSIEGAGLNGNFSLYLLKPDGSTLASNTCCGVTLTIVGKTLPSTGTYQIIVAPNNGVTGSITISLINQNTNGSISFGTPITSNIATASLLGLDFSGTAGQVVSLEVAGLGGGAFSVSLLNPDGSTLASTSACCGNSQISITGKTLVTTGTYQIVVAPSSGVTGSVTVSLISQTSNPAISFGTPVTSTITATSLIGLSFSGTASQVVSLEMTGLGGGAFSAFLLNPDGSTLASTSACCGNSQTSIIGKTLATTGTYQIVVVPNNGVTGSATVSLISQTTNPAISFGTPVTSNISVASLIGLSFSGSAGQVVSLEMAGLGGGSFTMFLLNPNGSTLASTSACCGTSQASIIGKTLATTGTYQVVVVPNDGVTGSETLSLISQTTNGNITIGTPVTNTINTTSLIALSFSGTAGQTISVQISPNFSGGRFTAYLLNPDGSSLTSASSTTSVTFSGKTLGSTGTYQIVIAPNNGVTGSATTTVTSP